MRFQRRHLLGVAVLGLAGGALSQRRFLELAAARAADAVGPKDRVAAARARRGDVVRAAVKAAGVSWPPKEVFIRAVKRNVDGGPGVVEAWAGNGTSSPLSLVLSHPICRLSGVSGPKTREGDLQVPEGYYSISALNPTSSYHLSLRVDYPNASDRVRNRRRSADAPLGGDIMVHGSCVTIGCIPIEDEPIEELYLLVAEVFGNSGKQRRVPIHIFPQPMTEPVVTALLATAVDDDTKALWRELQQGWALFEAHHRVPHTEVAADGHYVVSAPR